MVVQAPASYRLDCCGPLIKLSRREDELFEHSLRSEKMIVDIKTCKFL